MVVQAGAAEQVLEGDPVQVRASLQAIQQTGREARLELRRLLGVLRAGDSTGPDYGPQPGLGVLSALAEQLRSSGVDLTVTSDGIAHRVPPGLDLAAYRIVQEAVTNSIKHASGAAITVTLRWCADALDLEVRDTGGRDSGEPGAGLGLPGMRERAALYGGELEHGRQPDGGYRVHARLPVADVAS
jgi:signal transduction histidine kinase